MCGREFVYSVTKHHHKAENVLLPLMMVRMKESETGGGGVQK